MRKSSLIVGGGEMGIAVALRAAALGHRVVMAVRDEDSIGEWNRVRRFERIGHQGQLMTRKGGVGVPIPDNIHFASLKNPSQIREALSEAHSICITTPGLEVESAFRPIAEAAGVLDQKRPEEEAERRKMLPQGMPEPPEHPPIPQDLPVMICSRGITEDGVSAVSLFKECFPSYQNIFTVAAAAADAFEVALPATAAQNTTQHSLDGVHTSHELMESSRHSHGLAGHEVAIACYPNSSLRSRDVVHGSLMRGACWTGEGHVGALMPKTATTEQNKGTAGGNMAATLAALKKESRTDSGATEDNSSSKPTIQQPLNSAEILSILSSATLVAAVGAGFHSALASSASNNSDAVSAHHHHQRRYYSNAKLSMHRLLYRLRQGRGDFVGDAGALPLAVEAMLFDACTRVSGNRAMAFGRALVHQTAVEEAAERVFPRESPHRKELLQTILGVAHIEEQYAMPETTRAEPSYCQSEHSLFKAIADCTTGMLRASHVAEGVCNTTNWAHMAQVRPHPLMEVAKLLDRRLVEGVHRDVDEDGIEKGVDDDGSEQPSIVSRRRSRTQQQSKRGRRREGGDSTIDEVFQELNEKFPGVISPSPF